MFSNLPTFVRQVFQVFAAGVLFVLNVQHCHAQYQFEQPVVLPEPINLPGAWNAVPVLSAGRTELFYYTYRDNIAETLVVTREDPFIPFGTPSVVSHELFQPSLSQDGLTLYGNGNFGPNGESDIAYIKRDGIGLPWSSVEVLEENVNSDRLDRHPAISPDGLELYFTRTSSFTSNDADIWYATRESVDDEFGPAMELADEFNEGWVAPGGLSPDGLTLFLMSDRPGGFGNSDLYSLSRADKASPWGSLVNLGPTVNSAAGEMWPRMSFDGNELYFSRAPENHDINDQSTWFSDIYVAKVVPEPSGTAWLPLIVGSVYAFRRRRA